MAIGMTYDEYWHGDVLMARAFYKADRIKQQIINSEAWLYGAYNHRALMASVGNMFLKKGAKPFEYPEEPIGMKREETETEASEREDREMAYAKAYMANMCRAGKNWGKNKEVS